MLNLPIQRNRSLFFLSSIIIIIIVLLGIIYFLDKKGGGPAGETIIGLAAFETKINSLSSKKEVANSGYYYRIIDKFSILKNSNTSEKDKYIALLNIRI